ncbi:MAG: hypothetical protein LBP91_02170 [Coriobacteriales bacterium]|nr:hypothetical protein [Coriobacteriales bacterium]
MRKSRTAFAALLIAVLIATTPVLTACNGAHRPDSNGAQVLEGNVTGIVGTEYAAYWFNFTVNSLKTDSVYKDYAATKGNTLVIASITLTNTYGSPQQYGTFDWFVNDDSLSEALYPLNPFTSTMMPTDFTLYSQETVTFDVVIQYPANLANPTFTYAEINEKGETFSTFMIPIV